MISKKNNKDNIDGEHILCDNVLIGFFWILTDQSAFKYDLSVINSFVVLQVKFDSIRSDDQKNFPTALTVRITSQSFSFIYWNYCFFVGIFWQKKSGILISSSPPRSEITMIKHWKKLFRSCLTNVRFKFMIKHWKRESHYKCILSVLQNYGFT